MPTLNDDLSLVIRLKPLCLKSKPLGPLLGILCVCSSGFILCQIKLTMERQWYEILKTVAP